MRCARGLKNEALQLYFRSLAQTITVKLSDGWNPEEATVSKKAIEKVSKPLKCYTDSFTSFVSMADYGEKNKYSLKWYWGELLKMFGDTQIVDIQISDIQTRLLNRYASSNTSYSTAKRYYKCIFNLMVQLGF